MNYDRLMQEEIKRIQEAGTTPRLLLHSCCAPCSSACLEQLARVFRVTVLYYNPNIFPEEEYLFRKKEQQAFITRFPFENPVDFLDCEYGPEQFYAVAKGLEQEPERGERCTQCYRLRLARTAKEAAKGGFDFFATTLTLSPLKDCERLNRIGREEGERNGVPYLPSDFKKRNGYLRSIEITSAYGMYRQDYCGCAFSLRDRQARETAAARED